MALWKVELCSDKAQGFAIVEASSKSAAKNSAYNQFLGLEKSNITWDSKPTHWVMCKQIELVEPQELADEAG